MEPITRKEMFLAGAAGQDVPQLTPVTREEYFISQISAGGGGGGGGGNVLTLYVAPEFERGPLIGFKDENRTEKYASYDEAMTACMSACAILLRYYNVVSAVYDDNAYYVVSFEWSSEDGVVIVHDINNYNIYLYDAETENSGGNQL